MKQQKHSMKYAGKFFQTSLVSGTVVALLLSFTAAQAGLYRWVDSSGKVHFSDKIPPAMAQEGHTELAMNGVETKKVLSAEELQRIKDEEAAQADEKKQQQEKIALAEAMQAEQQKHDGFLLATFENQQELITYYEDKFSLLSGTANILKARNESLEDKIAGYKRNLAMSKTESRKNALQNNIDTTQTSIDQYQKALEENKQETIRLKKQYKKDLVRFVEITR